MTDWIMIIITAVYVIATIFICVANFKSAKATRDQITEQKRQFDETNRAYVTVHFEVSPSKLYTLCICNHGNKIAKGVHLEFEDSFIPRPIIPCKLLLFNFVLSFDTSKLNFLI